MSASEHIIIDGVSALLIERFDRVASNGVVYRLHQEDFAQAMGLPAGLKYQRYGRERRRFDANRIRTLLDELASPAEAVELFVLTTIFNLAIGNTDNHAKNHAILYGDDGVPHLAPLYDLLPVRLQHHYTHQLAFNIGNAAHFDEMNSSDMRAFLAIFGIEGARLKRFIDGPVRSVLETLETRSEILRAMRMRPFDDLIGRELGRLSELMNMGLTLRERDYVGPPSGGWLPTS